MPGVARDDPDRWALDLLGAVLGDGMGSRLFLDLRERRSLVYDVSTFSASYADVGSFGVHAGFDPDDAERRRRRHPRPAGSDLLRARRRLPSSSRARAYTRGRLELRMEDSGAVAGWIGTGEALLPRILTVEEVIERLEAVTVDDLLRVAQRYLAPDGCPARRPRAVPLSRPIRARDATVTRRSSEPADAPEPARSGEEAPAEARWPPTTTHVIDILPDELTLARAQLDAGQPALAEGTARARIALREADGPVADDELDALRALLAESLWRQGRLVARAIRAGSHAAERARSGGCRW